MTNLEILIKTCVELGSAQTIETMGLASGEISRSKAIATYGKYFKEAEKQGRIRPVRVGTGRNGKKVYRIKDILSLKANDLLKAELKDNFIR